MSRRQGSSKTPRVDDANPQGPRTGRLGRVHDRVLDIFAEIEAGTSAERAFARVFQRSRDLGPRERAVVRDTVYAWLRSARRVDDRLERVAKEHRKKFELLAPPMRNRIRLLVHFAEQGLEGEDLAARDPDAFRRVPGLFSKLLQGRLQDVARTDVDRIALACGLPTWMVVRLVGAFGASRAEAIASALQGRAPVTLRVNRLRATRDAVRERIRSDHGINCAPTTRSPDGLILPHGIGIETWDLFEEGSIELQDEGSQLVALATRATEGESVLDACAGAGGKTLALAAMMKNRGRLVAVDSRPQMVDRLRERAARAGVECVDARVADLMELPRDLAGTFDCALVDAPCTGTGTLRRHPDLPLRLRDADVARRAELQHRLLGATVAALRPGGRLVYATCSVFDEENESVARHALETDARLRPHSLEPELGLGSTTAGAPSHCARIGPGPGEDGPDGFFIASFARR